MLVIALFMPAAGCSQRKGISDRQKAIVMNARMLQEAGHPERAQFAPDAVEFDRPSAMIIEEHVPRHQGIESSQNDPNPFNPSTRIEYSLGAAAEVSLRVYNLLGQEIATLVRRHQEAGTYKVPFHESDLSSGVYFYRLEAGPLVSIKRIVLIR
jgi:hypothetical protein